jgi:hypothetical protein
LNNDEIATVWYEWQIKGLKARLLGEVGMFDNALPKTIHRREVYEATLFDTLSIRR